MSTVEEAVEFLRLGTSNRRLDPVVIAQGVRKECPFRPGLHVMILPAASYNPRYRKALQNARTKDPQEEGFVARYDSPEFVAEAYVADMDGLFGRDGQPVRYTSERGLGILKRPENADVLEWIATEAHNYGAFYIEAVEADAGN